MPKVVAIVGPPNSGKSTLYNRLTGLRQKVANFPGVTVEGGGRVGIGRTVVEVVQVRLRRVRRRLRRAR
mgnify:CR=1 FL=1